MLHNINIERLNSLDYVFLTILLVCIARGLWRGGTVILFNTLGFFAGFFVSIHYYKEVEVFIKTFATSIGRADIVAFVLLFLISWFLVGWIGHWLSTIWKYIRLKFLDRLLGGLIGLVLAIAVQGVIFSVLTLFVEPSHSILKDSQLAPLVSKSSAALYSVVSKHMGKELEERQKTIKKYWKERFKTQEKS